MDKDNPNRSEQTKEQMKAYSKVVKKAWTDPDFKTRLLGDPTATLRAEGFAVPEGSHVHVVENHPDHINFVLPNNPAESGAHADLPFIGDGGTPPHADLPFIGETGARTDLPFHGAAPLPFHNAAMLPFLDPKGD